MKEKEEEKDKGKGKDGTNEGRIKELETKIRHKIILMSHANEK